MELTSLKNQFFEVQNSTVHGNCCGTRALFFCDITVVILSKEGTQYRVVVGASQSEKNDQFEYVKHDWKPN